MTNDVLHILEEQLIQLDARAFIEADPISIPLRFSRKEDIEIAAFFAANLAWGRRETILRSVNLLMHMMDEEPFAFLQESNRSEWDRLLRFTHRTFQGVDAVYFAQRLQIMYRYEGGLSAQFGSGPIREQLIAFHRNFFNVAHHPERSRKHLADPSKGSAAKRMNLFLRWMVRKDRIDIGLWDHVDRSALICPLDVHVRRSGMYLGLLQRKSSDWMAAEELTGALRALDPKDPVRFDLALFVLSERGALPA